MVSLGGDTGIVAVWFGLGSQVRGSESVGIICVSEDLGLRKSFSYFCQKSSFASAHGTFD